jgi:hypothetical protein
MPDSDILWSVPGDTLQMSKLWCVQMCMPILKLIFGCINHDKLNLFWVKKRLDSRDKSSDAIGWLQSGVTVNYVIWHRFP